MGPRGGLGVVLDGKGRQLLVAQALQGVVVQVEVGEFHLGVGDGVDVHREAVVLAGDFHPAGEAVLHGLVAAPVAELELEGASPQGQTHELVPQADAEQGFLAQALPGVVDAVGHRRGVAGAVGQDDAVGIQGQNVGGRGFRRNYQHLQTPGLEGADNVEFHPEIVENDFFPRALVP